jgi:DNA-binding CsgD family transcriptional regulator
MRRAPTASPPTLLDRESASRALNGALSAAEAQGAVCVARIVAPPGYGKTAFLTQVAADEHGRGRLVLYAAARPLESGSPFAILRRLFETAAQHLGSGLPKYVSGLEPALTIFFAKADPHGDPPAAAATERATARFLAAVSADTPLTILVDDFQWADLESEMTLAYLAETLPGTACRIVLADRRSAARSEPWNRTVIALSPLRDRFAASLVREYYADAPAAVVTEIVTASKGIPFDVVALAQGAATSHAKDAVDVNGSLSHLVLERLSRAEEIERELLRHAAFITEPIDVRILVRLAGASVLSTVLPRTIDFLEQDGPYVRFKHARLGDAVRSTVDVPLPYERRILDVQLAVDDATLDGCTRIAALSERCAELELAARYRARCGALLTRAGAWTSAATEYRRALELTRPEASDGLLLDYVRVLRVLVRDDEAIPSLRAALERAIVRRDLSSVEELSHALVAAYATVEQVDAVEAVSDSVASRIASLDPACAQRIRDDVLQLAAIRGDVSPLDAPSGDASAARIFAWTVASGMRGSSSDANRGLARLRTIYEAQDSNRGVRLDAYTDMLALHLACYENGAGALADWWESAGRQRLFTDHHPEHACALGIASAFFAGHWADGFHIAEEANLDRLGVATRPHALAPLFMIDAFMRRPPRRAEQLFTDLRVLFARGRIRAATPAATWLSLARHRANQPVPSDIVAATARGLATRPEFDVHWAIPIAAVLFGRAFGHESAAHAALDAYAEYAAPWHGAQLAFAKAAQDNDHRAMTATRVRFDELGAPGMSLIVSLELGSLRAQDRMVAERCELSLAQEGPRTADPRTKLTRRECDVAACVLQGLTNREIAGRLVLSERTVEVHLGNIFGKLNIRSRTELVVALSGYG